MSTSMGRVEGLTVTTGVVCGGVGKEGKEGEKVVAGVGWVRGSSGLQELRQVGVEAIVFLM